MNNGNKMLKTGPRFENGGRFSLPKKPRRVRSPQAANSVPSIFRGGVYVAKNTLRGESVPKWAKSPFGRAGRSENSFDKKGAALFVKL